MRHGGLPLYAGVALLALLLALAACGPVFMPQDPTEMHTTRYFAAPDGKLALKTPPFPPSAEFPWGTDYLGRDIMSRFLSGCRYTLLLALGAVLVRFILAVPLGLLATQPALSLLGRLVSGAAALGGAVPTLFVSLIVISVLASFARDIVWSVLVFIGVLGVVGAPRLAEDIRRAGRGIMVQPFIEAAQATGCSAARIAVRHVLPGLVPRLLVAFPLEAANVLGLIGQLGLFGIFIGRSFEMECWVDLAGSGAVFTWFDIRIEPATGEWSSSLAWARRFMRQAPWMFLPAMGGFLAAILGFSFLGEGLRRRLHGGGAA
jgi:peptide/nickel transport system permease protein